MYRIVFYLGLARRPLLSLVSAGFDDHAAAEGARATVAECLGLMHRASYIERFDPGRADAVGRTATDPLAPLGGC
jgi:hypothetical protein